MNEKVLVSKDLLNDLGNKFKHLTGENKKFTIQEMINANNFGRGTEDELVMGRIRNYVNNSITEIRNYGFYHCVSLETIRCKKVKKIGIEAFSYCDGLETAIFDNVDTIEAFAFMDCIYLTDLYLGYKGVVNTFGFGDYAGDLQGYVNVHVRQEYASQYATATNWKDLISSGKVVIIGDYEEVMLNE